MAGGEGCMETNALDALRRVSRVMREESAKLDGEPEIAEWLDDSAGTVSSFLVRAELGEGEEEQAV